MEKSKEEQARRFLNGELGVVVSGEGLRQAVLGTHPDMTMTMRLMLLVLHFEKLRYRADIEKAMQDAKDRFGTENAASSSAQGEFGMSKFITEEHIPFHIIIPETKPMTHTLLFPAIIRVDAPRMRTVKLGGRDAFLSFPYVASIEPLRPERLDSLHIGHHILAFEEMPTPESRPYFFPLTELARVSMVDKESDYVIVGGSHLDCGGAVCYGNSQQGILRFKEPMYEHFWGSAFTSYPRSPSNFLQEWSDLSQSNPEEAWRHSLRKTYKIRGHNILQSIWGRIPFEVRKNLKLGINKWE